MSFIASTLCRRIVPHSARRCCQADGVCYAVLKHIQRNQSQTSSLSDATNSGQLRTGVNFDTLGSWNNRLEMPINMEESIRRGKLIPKISLDAVGEASLLGRRADNEDRLLAKQLAPNLLLFGIFDGHGGKMAADYVHNRLVSHVMFWLDRGEKDLTKILHNTFIDVNNSFTKFLYHNFINGSERAFASGCTATVCLVRNGTELVVAHVGDSRAMLCRNNKPMRLTVDHEPELQLERERIERCHGHVTWSSLGRPRVNGVLEMTRSIGDVDLKPFGVTAQPDINKYEVRHGSDSFLVLTTDGIHSCLNSREIVQVISGCVDPHEAARFLTDQALLFGSEDNCSALVVPFGAWCKFNDTSQQVHFTRSRSLMSRKHI